MSNKCKVCNKSVYPMDPQINLDGSVFHKTCAKCQDCNCQITLSNFTKNEADGVVTLLCKTHYFKRFHEQGSYLGGDKFQVKNPRDQHAGAPPAPTASSAPAAATPETSEAASGGAYAGVKLKPASAKSDSDTADREVSKTGSVDSITAATESVQLNESIPCAPAPTPEPTSDHADHSALQSAAQQQLSPPTPPQQEPSSSTTEATESAVPEPPAEAPAGEEATAAESSEDANAETEAV